MKKITKHFTLIELMIVVAIIAVIATIAVPQLLDARRNTNERSCIGTLRTLGSDQATYLADNSLYGTLAQLNTAKKVNLTIAKAGYSFGDLIVVPTADAFAVKGAPVTGGSSGKKLFAVTSGGTVRQDPAVTTAFAVSNAAGLAAITASLMVAVIAAGSEQTGIDLINSALYQEAK